MSREPAGGMSIEAIIVEGFASAGGLELVDGTLPNGAFADGALLDGTEAGGLGTELNGVTGAPRSTVSPEIGAVSVSSAAGANAGGGLTFDFRPGLALDAGELAGGGGEFDGVP